MKAIATVATMALLCVFAAELAGALFCYRETGRLVYLGGRPQLEQVAPSMLVGTRLHPYFGYVSPYRLVSNDSGGGLFTSNLGFWQRGPLTVPFEVDPADFVVAVLGGSVATNVAVALQGGETLERVLAAAPQLAGRHVVVINMAQGGGKQPNAIIALALLLTLGQHLDLVVDVDGYNEFELAADNILGGTHPILPPLISMRPFAYERAGIAASPRYFELSYLVASARLAAAKYAKAAAGARFGLAYAFDRVRAVRAGNDLAALTADYEAVIHDLPADWGVGLGMDMPPTGFDAKHMPEQLFDLWLRSADQVAVIARGNGIPLVHVVQPNQYFSRHRFSDAEKAIAFVGTPTLVIADAYRLVAERGDVLAAHGIVSAIDIFDEVDEPIYVDTCCHYNARGETLLARFIAERVFERLAMKR